MKIITTFAWIVLGLTLSSWTPDKKIKGSGHIITETRETGAFDQVNISGGIDLVLTQGDACPLRIEGDDNLLQYIDTEVQNHTLIIRRNTRKDLKPSRSLKIYVTVPDLKQIAASAASDVSSTNLWRVEKMEIRLSAAADLNFKIDADELTLSASAASDSKLEGRVNYFKVKASAASDITARKLQAKTADIVASAASSVYVTVTEELSYDLTGASSLTYYGRPRIEHARSVAASSVRQAKP